MREKRKINAIEVFISDLEILCKQNMVSTIIKYIDKILCVNSNGVICEHPTSDLFLFCFPKHVVRV